MKESSMRVLYLILLFLVSFLFQRCSTKPVEGVSEQQFVDDLFTTASLLTEVMVYDVYSPPQASRVYAYVYLAAYEAGRLSDAGWLSIAPQLNGEPAIPEPKTPVDGRIAGIIAMQEVAIKMLYSYGEMESWQQSWIDSMRHRLPQDVWDQSVAYGKEVANAVMSYASADGFDYIRTLPRYMVTHQAGIWKPTPPAYMDAVDPHWNKLRSFTLDSAQQFRPSPPIPYDGDKGSAFYQSMLEVYEVTNALSSEQQDIASFWDCNPYVAYTQGHFMMGNKKITPGGHWMGIAHTACVQQQVGFVTACAVMAHTAIALADGFISCWDEKYRSNYIRPETAINQLHDPDWKPLLQTPPFPEYTSGHSVISSAASTVLTHHFGDPFSYVDSVEVPYGLPARSYHSFKQAADEAAISRLYGGIHFRPAIENGVEQGRLVGEWVVNHIHFK